MVITTSKNIGKIPIVWKTYGETHTPYDETEAPMVKQYVFPYRFRPCAPSKYTILDTIRIEDFFFDYIEVFGSSEHNSKVFYTYILIVLSKE